MMASAGLRPSAIGGISEEVERATLEGTKIVPTSSSSKDESVANEKGEVFDLTARTASSDDENETAVLLSHEHQFPIDPHAVEETHQFTFRAVLVGCILGAVISASK